MLKAKIPTKLNSPLIITRFWIGRRLRCPSWLCIHARMKESTLKKFLRRDTIDLDLALHRADCLGCHGMLDTYKLCVEKLAEFRKAGAEEALRPKPLLTGADLIALGHKPGPRFKEILSALEDAQLERSIATREEAEELVRERFPAPA